MSDLIEECTGLTYLECKDFLQTGSLPDNFRSRIDEAVKLFDEGYIWCRNCEGVQDMNHVFRDWWAEEPFWCPSCVDISEVNKRTK